VSTGGHTDVQRYMLCKSASLPDVSKSKNIMYWTSSLLVDKILPLLLLMIKQIYTNDLVNNEKYVPLVNITVLA